MGLFDGALCQFCLCGRRKDSTVENTTRDVPDDDDAYGTIGPVDAEPKTSKSGARVTFRLGKTDKNSNRSSKVSTEEPKRTSKSSIFGMSKNSKHSKNRPSRELPQIPSKKVPFSRSNIPHIDEPNIPTYECIDADSISDPVYSKVDENPSTQKYDYPIFSRGKKKKVIEEPLYTSASQIYSGGSEDPYSSIISERVNDDTYDPGYARVREPPSTSKDSTDHPSTSRAIPPNLDQLYAKINRPASKKSRLPLENGSIPTSEPLPSTSGVPTNQAGMKPSTSFTRDVPITRPFDTNTSFYQLDESGSGSIVSGSSQNPSYRYLTVRETVDVIRERIRRRQQGLPELSVDVQNMVPIREHYYSTIQNEYESVGGGSMTDSIYGTAINPSVVEGPIPGPSSTFPRPTHRSSPLTLNVTRLYHGSGSSPTDQLPPKPPTSPIPNRTLAQTPTTSGGPTKSMSGMSRSMVESGIGSARPTVISPAPMVRLPVLPEMSASMIEKRISYTEVEEKSNSNPNLAAYQARSRSMAHLPHGQGPPPSSSRASHISTILGSSPTRPIDIPGSSYTLSSVYPRGAPRTISSTSTIFPSEKRWRDSRDYPSSSRRSTPLENGYATLSRDASIDTTEFPKSTVDSETQTHSSRIPVPISARKHDRSRSPSADASTQTNGVGEEDKKKGPPPLPTPSGRDYISPIDLSSKRAWPLASGKAESSSQTK